MVDLSQLNPFKNFNVGLGTLGNVLVLFFIGVLIVGGITFWIILKINNKKYIHKIPLWKLIGNTPTRVAIYLAKDFPIGKAGDKLWFVRGAKKYIAPGTIQSAPHEYMHWEREDGEWINFSMGNLDKSQKEAGVKYIHQDMRSQRIATNNILEQRLINKGFWEKYKDIIVHLIFYFIVTIMMVVIFWQWSKIVEQVGALINKLDQMITQQNAYNKPANSLVPAISLLIFKFKNIGRKKCQ